MIYMWEIPENYKNRDIGQYDRDCSPNSFLLKRGRCLAADELSPMPTVNFIVAKQRLLKLDCLANDTLVPLINQRVKRLLEDLIPDEVQFFSARCLCTDGELECYYFLNITHMVKGIDHEKSKYSKMLNADAILGFRYLTYKPECMKSHKLARDQEYMENLLVNEEVKLLFEKERITGVWFVRPEEFYRPISELL